MNMNREKLIALIAVSAVVGYSAMALALDQTQRPKPLEVGNPDVTMAQARTLLAAYRSAGWDDMKVDQRLFRVPDQALDPTDYRRTPGQRTFCVQKGIPEYSEIAFMTDLYVDLHFKPVRGKEATTSPEGFFIVAWKNGTVEKVPVDRVRMYATIHPRTNEPVKVVVFPGMDEYRIDLPKFPGVK